MEFQSIKEIKDFLENSDREERDKKSEELKKVAPLFRTNLYNVISKLQKSRKDVRLMVDTYFDYNMENNFGKEKVYYDSGDGISFYSTDRDMLVNDMLVVYSLLIDGKKIAVAAKKSTLEKCQAEKEEYLTPKYLQTITLNLLGAQAFYLYERKSMYDDEFYGLFSSNKKTPRLKGDNRISPLYIARGSDAHKAVINCPKLNTVMWQIVAENVEKEQERQTNIVLKDIRYRKMVLNRFCKEAEMIKKDLQFEQEFAMESPQDRQIRERIRMRFEAELKEKEEYKDQEKALIAHLHNKAKDLKINDAKNDLSLILK